MSWLSTYSKYRLLEMVPGSLVWLTLIGVVIVTFVNPVIMIYVVIVFDFYWMMKIIYLSSFLLLSFHHYRRVMATNWFERCQQLVRYPNICHVIFLPHASENRAVVEATLQKLAATTYPKERLLVVYAVEERFPASVEIAEQLAAKYRDKFGHFFISRHPANLAGEIAAKGANLAFAGQSGTD